MGVDHNTGTGLAPAADLPLGTPPVETAEVTNQNAEASTSAQNINQNAESSTSA